MFDIGFPELVVVSIVALVVIGPERLPETVRTIMLWIGRVRQTFTNIKTELEQEIGADEIRRQLHNETILKEINESKETISNSLQEVDKSIDEFKHGVAEINQNLEQSSSKNLEESARQNANQDTQKKAQ